MGDCCITQDHSRLFLVGGTGVLRCFDLATEQLDHRFDRTLRGKYGLVRNFKAIVVTRNGDKLIIAYDNGLVLFGVREMKELRRFEQVCIDKVANILLLRDETKARVCSVDGTFKIMSLRTGIILISLHHKVGVDWDWVRMFATDDRRFVFSEGHVMPSSTLRKWDIQSYQCVERRRSKWSTFWIV